MNRDEQEKVYAQQKRMNQKAVMIEDKRLPVILGVIFGIVFGVFIFVKEPEMPLFDKVGLTLTFIWIGINMMTYRGRYRPKILYALKICYPLFLFILILAALGRL